MMNNAKRDHTPMKLTLKGRPQAALADEGVNEEVHLMEFNLTEQMTTNDKGFQVRDAETNESDNDYESTIKKPK